MSEENSPPVKVSQPQTQKTSEVWINLSVQLRSENLSILEALAAREGATPEAMAALLLEEKLSEAKSHRA